MVSALGESGNIPSSLPLLLLPARPGMSFRATGPWRVVCPSWGAPLVRSGPLRGEGAARDGSLLPKPRLRSGFADLDPVA
jgi:hypothetical protein